MRHKETDKKNDCPASVTSKLGNNAQWASNSQKASDAIRQVSENGEIHYNFYKSLANNNNLSTSRTAERQSMLAVKNHLGEKGNMKDFKAKQN